MVGRPRSEADLGRFTVTGNEADRHVFRVPSLRNVAVTAPYFHDGRTSSLAEAVEIMAQSQLGRTMPTDDVEAIIKGMGAEGGAGGPAAAGPRIPPFPRVGLPDATPLSEADAYPDLFEARRPLIGPALARGNALATAEIGGEDMIANVLNPDVDMTEQTIGVLRRKNPISRAAALRELQENPDEAALRGIDIDRVLAAFDLGCTTELVRAGTRSRFVAGSEGEDEECAEPHRRTLPPYAILR